MNSVSIAGRLSRNIELKTTPTGRSVVDTNVAVRRTEDEADFINVQIWGNLADIVARYCSKGTFVAVQGKLRVSSYTDRDGNKRTNTFILADSVDFVGSSDRKEIPQTGQEGISILEDELSDVLATDEDLPF